MPEPRDWITLRHQLEQHGYLDEEDAGTATVDGQLSAHLVEAIKGVFWSSGQTEEDVRLEPFEREDAELFEGVRAILDSRFCGVPDQGGQLGPLAFGSPGGRWSKGGLRVSINPAGFQAAAGAAMVNPTAVITSAFGQWQAASRYFNFTFVPVGTGEDVRVVFGGTNLDPRFGGSGGVLGSAGYPERGNLQLDSAETWTANGLLGLALHEIGHLLGLSHSNTPNTTMYPYVPSLVTIDVQSQNAIAAMYGWQPQQRLADRGTSDRPVLGATSGANFTSRWDTPQMVWKGIGSDTAVYASEMQAGAWTPQAPIRHIGCSSSPALTQLADASAATPTMGLLMAWKGIPGDQGIYWTRHLAGSWEGQRPLEGVGTSHGPAVATLNGQVYMAWKGVEGDSGIYVATYDGAEGWSPQAVVPGVGTSASPALVAFEGSLYMFWKGAGSDSGAYYTFLDVANDPIWKPQEPIKYAEYETGGGVPHHIGTSTALSASVRGNQIFLTWKGAGDDSTIWCTLYRNREFGGQIPLANIGTSTGASTVSADGSTYLAWKGIEGDTAIYWSRL